MRPRLGTTPLSCPDGEDGGPHLRPSCCPVPRRGANAERILALVLALVAACLDARPGMPDRGEPGDPEPGITSGTGDPVVPGMPPVATEPPGATESLGGADSTGDEPPSSFIMTNDWASAFACDLFAQDCSPGEKCMPWSTDGGAAWNWNGTRCSPIAADPGEEGEPCTVVDGAMSGIDDCGGGLMCWWVDETGEGTCEDMCTGSADQPICDDPDEVCPISAAGVLILCLDACDPLAQDCDKGACYPLSGQWICAPGMSGDTGTHGDPCEYINACDDGHVCLGAAAFTNCAGAVGCCSTVCNVEDREADAACAVLDPGQSCEAWYPEGNAPPGYELIGVCALPA